MSWVAAKARGTKDRAKRAVLIIVKMKENWPDDKDDDGRTRY